MQTRAYWTRNNMTFRDETHGPTAGGSFWQFCPMVAMTDPSVGSVFYDDFWEQDSTKAAQSGVWTIVEDDGAGGTDGVLDARGGQYQQFCDGDDNDESYLSTTNEQWIITAGYSLWMEARVRFVEGNTNDGNFIVGMTDAAGANMLQDNGAGPAASYDGAVFWVLENSLVVNFETSNAGTQSTATTCGSHTTANLANYGIWFRTESTSDTVAVVTPYVDGTAYTARNITLAGLAEMEFTVGAKSDGNAEESIIIDYVKIVQIRN